MILIAFASSDGSDEPCTNLQSCESLLCTHTPSKNKEKGWGTKISLMVSLDCSACIFQERHFAYIILGSSGSVVECLT